MAESEQSSEQREKIFTDIVGGDDRHGRVRTYGFGPSRTDVFGRQAARTGPSDEDLANLRQQIRGGDGGLDSGASGCFARSNYG